MNSNTSYYVMLSKRYLSRYVLTYELLPLELCFDVNERKIFSEIELEAMFAQNLIDEKSVVLGLKNNLPALYHSYSNIAKIGFINQDSLEMFVERSYENYDLNSIECYTLDSGKGSKNLPLNILEPQLVDKYQFARKMALNDAITVAVQRTLLSFPDFYRTVNQYIGDAESLLKATLNHYVNDTNQLNMAIQFFKVCSEFNIDSGWQLSEVVEQFKKRIASNNIASPDVEIWVETAKKIIDNEDVKLIYTDENNVALRAMILVLLNPEKQNIDAMKTNLNEGLGGNVYALASLFVVARTGYSYLNAAERNQIANRADLQLLNASLYNEVTTKTSLVIEPLEVTSEVEAIPCDKFSLSQATWLTLETENRFRMNGVKPMAGFDLALEYIEGEFLGWRLIDANGGKGLDKLKGQLALNILSIQKDLPNQVRAEIIEQRGLYLTLPFEWALTSDIIDCFKHILTHLIHIKVAQKSSKLF